MTTTIPQQPDKIDAAVLKVAGVVVLGAIMSILDVTVVNVALPTFQRELDVANYSTVAWTVTGYTLALATVIPLAGWATDRFGTKRIYLLALTLFTLGSLLCATAWSIESLIAFRVLQGLGGGMLMPVGMTILTRAAGPQRMGRLMAVLGIPMLLGPIFGPILGGWMIDIASWHWIFLINLPIGLAALVYALRVLPGDDSLTKTSLDVRGVLLMSPGLALFLYGVSAIPEHGTMAATEVWATMLAGAVLVIAFVRHSFRPQYPLLDLRLFKNYDLSVSALTMFLFAAAFFGALLLLPTYFQQVRGESALSAGWLVAPQGLGAMLTMPIAGTLVDRIPVGRIVPVGLAAIMASMFGLTQIEADTSYTTLIALLFVMGLGMGGTMMPLMTAALRTLRGQQVARGTTMLNIIQQVASSVGVAVMAVVFTNRQQASDAVSAAQAAAEAQRAGVQPPDWALQVIDSLGNQFEAVAQADLASAFATSFWVAFALCALTFVVSLFLPRRSAAPRTEDEAATPVVAH